MIYKGTEIHDTPFLIADGKNERIIIEGTYYDDTLTREDLQKLIDAIDSTDMINPVIQFYVTDPYRGDYNEDDGHMAFSLVGERYETKDEVDKRVIGTMQRIDDTLEKSRKEIEYAKKLQKEAEVNMVHKLRELGYKVTK